MLWHLSSTFGSYAALLRIDLLASPSPGAKSSSSANLEFTFATRTTRVYYKGHYPSVCMLREKYKRKIAAEMKPLQEFDLVRFRPPFAGEMSAAPSRAAFNFPETSINITDAEGRVSE